MSGRGMDALMAPEQDSILSDLLSRWHQWARGYSPVPTQGCAPMFRQHITPKGWDSTADIVDSTLDDTTMKTIDFQVAEMQEPHRSAIYMHARNCYTGHKVWTSPRLPTDALERGMVVCDAKAMLLARLRTAGVV